jgi:hypothetical protein
MKRTIASIAIIVLCLALPAAASIDEVAIGSALTVTSQLTINVTGSVVTITPTAGS